MSTQATSREPPKLAMFDAAEFRRKLSGLAAPERTASDADKKDVRGTAIRFCSILAKLHNDDVLAAEKKWDRISSALATAIAKVSDDDVDRFATLCLDHVMADPSKSATCPALAEILVTAESKPPEWRHALLGYFATHGQAAVVHGRARWELVKRQEVAL